MCIINNRNTPLSDVESVIAELFRPSEEHEDQETLVHRVWTRNEEVTMLVWRASSHHHPVSSPNTKNLDLERNDASSTCNEESISNNNFYFSRFTSIRKYSPKKLGY